MKKIFKVGSMFAGVGGICLSIQKIKMREMTISYVLIVRSPNGRQKFLEN